MYKSQSARDAQAGGYGSKTYWDYLDEAAQRHFDYYMAKGDEATAKKMFTQSLSEAIAGNKGD